MPKQVKIRGVDNVFRRLNKEVNKIEGRTESGMWLAGLQIKSKATDYTPWDTGNLVNSCYVVVSGGREDTQANFNGKDAGKLSAGHSAGVGRAKSRVGRGGKLRAEVGYTAFYSIYTHEILFQNYSKPGTSWKYLERAVREEMNTILDMIAKEAGL